MTERIKYRVLRNGPPVGEIMFDDITPQKRLQLIAHYQGIVAMLGSDNSSNAKKQLKRLLEFEDSDSSQPRK